MASFPNFRKHAQALSIHPPGHSHSNHQSQNDDIPTPIHSPRRAPIPPSPTQSSLSNASAVSGTSGLSSQQGGSSSTWGGFRRGSSENPGFAPPVPAGRYDKRLPAPPNVGVVPPSPQHRKMTGQSDKGNAGMYDTKLVSSTLSQLPLIPPLSPTPTGNSSHHTPSQPAAKIPSKPSFASLTSQALSHAAQAHQNLQNQLHHHNHKITHTAHNAVYPHSYALGQSTPRQSVSGAASSSVVVLPDGTALPTASEGLPEVRSMAETMAHSSPNSPWSLLTIHVLPLFAGGPLKTPIEDLNQLCHSHIIATSQRTAASRLLAVLGSDLRDFIASGMLTLKAKIETVDEGKLIAKAAEVWTFFWTHVLPYLEGVFLPFSQLRDVPSTSFQSTSTAIPYQALQVRNLLLSGFLLHILLPLLPRLIPIITMSQSAAASLGAEAARLAATPSTTDLQRILQMSLVLSTQAKYSSFVPPQNTADNDRRDVEVRDNVDGLGKAVRWKMAAMEQERLEESQLQHENAQTHGSETAPGGPGLTRKPSVLQRGPSMSQSAGRMRRKGWRASSSQWLNAGGENSHTLGPVVENTRNHRPSFSVQPSRQNSEFLAPDARWGKPSLGEDDDDDITPNQSWMPPNRQDSLNTMTSGGTASTAASTLTAGTMSTVTPGGGGGSSGTYGDHQRTPLAEFGARRTNDGALGTRHRADSSGSSEVTPMPPNTRRTQRV